MSTNQAVARPRTAVVDDIVILVRDTVTVFGRLFPQIMAVWLLGWLGDAVAVRIAAIVGDHSGWAAVVVFSASFLFDLVAVVVILRLAGEELGIRALIPESETGEGEAGAGTQDNRLSRIVAVTLLPFLGLYSAFGLVDKKAGQLTTEQLFRGGGVFSGGPSVLNSVRGLATNHTWWMVGLLVGVYVLRRLVDHLHERTGIRLLGILTAVIESFFILIVIFGGFLLLARPGRWLADRQFTAWLDTAGRAVEQALAALNLHLPALLHRFGAFLADPVWPMFWTVISQPIIWLAVAALVFGSQVLSLADLWRRGRPAAQRIVGSSRFDRRKDKRALRPVAPAGVARLGGEVKEAFLGDIDDKYLPTFHSIRLILRAGVGFLGAFVLVYTVILIAQNSVQQLYLSLIGGRDADYWYLAGPGLDLVDNLPWEPLRLCLLAVAFRRCLELFHRRVGPEAGEASAPPIPATPLPAPGIPVAPVRVPRGIPRPRVVGAVLAVALVTVAAIGYRVSDPDSPYELVRAPLDQPTRFATGTVEVSDVRVATELAIGQERLRTQGMFVVANLTLRATGSDKVTVGNERLVTADGEVYLPAFALGNTITVEPGFQSTKDVVFEVDPRRIDGLTLELWDVGIFFRYYERTQTPLGITSANAPQWAQAGAGRLVTVQDDAVRTGLS